MRSPIERGVPRISIRSNREMTQLPRGCTRLGLRIRIHDWYLASIWLPPPTAQALDLDTRTHTREG